MKLARRLQHPRFGAFRKDNPFRIPLQFFNYTADESHGRLSSPPSAKPQPFIIGARTFLSAATHKAKEILELLKPVEVGFRLNPNLNRALNLNRNLFVPERGD